MRRQRKEGEAERRASFTAPDKPLSVQQGTHWRAYKQGDKRCLQRLKGRKRAQLAQEGGLPVPPAHCPLAAPRSTEPGFLLGWEAELGVLLTSPFPSSRLLPQPDAQGGGPASPRALLRARCTLFRQSLITARAGSVSLS